MALVAALAAGCSERRPDRGARDDAGDRRAQLDDLGEALDARLARIDSLQACDAGGLASLVRMAAGTWGWRDEIAHPPKAVTRDAQYLAEQARARALRSAETAIDQCTSLALEAKGQRMRVALGAELGRDESVDALVALLGESEHSRKVVLEILARAPAAPMRAAVGPFVSGSRSARRAFLAIDDLPVVYQLRADWTSWIASRVGDGTARSIDDLFAVARGQLPTGCPTRPETRWTEVRRAASQAARELLSAQLGSSPEHRAFARDLLLDPDPRIRRDGIRILDGRADASLQPIFSALAADDPDPQVRLAAASAADALDVPHPAP